jgi:hypothetical protein
VEREPVIYREEAVAMLLAIHDMNDHLDTIRRLLEGGADGEEEDDG